MKYLMLTFVLIFYGCASKSYLCEIQEVQNEMQNLKAKIGESIDGNELESVRCKDGIYRIVYNISPNSSIAKVINNPKGQDLYKHILYSRTCTSIIIKNGLTIEQVFMLKNGKMFLSTINPNLCEYMSKNNMFIEDITKKIEK